LTQKVCTVSWNCISRLWAEGGLDIKSTRLINASLIMKLAWNLLATDSQRASLLKQRFLSNGKPVTHYFKSYVWSGIKLHIIDVIYNSLWIVGTGENLSLWNDNWLGTPIVDLFHIDPYFHVEFKGKV